MFTSTLSLGLKRRTFWTASQLWNRFSLVMPAFDFEMLANGALSKSIHKARPSASASKTETVQVTAVQTLFLLGFVCLFLGGGRFFF